MWRRFLPSARWRSAIVNGTAGTAVAAVVVVGLSIDDSVVTQVDALSTGIWLQAELSGELVLIDPASGVATTRVRVTDADVPVEVIDTDDLVGVVERSTGNLVTVDPALGTVAGKAPLYVTDVSDVVVAGDAWVVGAASLARVPLDGAEPSLVEVPGPSTSAAASRDGVSVVIDETRVDVSAAGVTGGGKQSFGLAVANVGGQVATIAPADGSVVLDDGTTTCIHGDVGAETVWGGSTTGPRIVVGANSVAGTIHVSLLDDDRCLVYDLAEQPSGEPDAGSPQDTEAAEEVEPTAFSRPLVVDNVVYVADTATGRMHIVNLGTDVVRSRTFFRSGEQVDLIDHAGEVIAHEPRTYRGGVFGPNGFRRLINKGAGRQLVSAVSGETPLVVGGGEGGAVESARAEGEADLEVDLLLNDPVVLGLDEVADTPDTEEELVANFAYSAARVQVGVVVTFVDESTGNPRSWTWDFGDGSNDSGPRVAHAWSEPGTYQVTLTIDREDGASNSTAALIEVVPEETVLAPVADFNFSESRVAVGEAVRFTDVTVGEVTERQWSFGDGSQSTEADVSKSWPTPGSYVVTLTVSNEAGTDSASATITVVEQLQPPKAVIEVSATQVEVGEPVRIRSVSTGDISRLFWDLGDGDVAASPEVVHTYTVEGSYTVTLSVANSAGSDTATVTIEVIETTLPPDARIAALPPIIESGRSVTLSSTSLNNPQRLDWEFGDGTTGTGTPVSHAWADPGTYVVTLTATNESGSDSTTATVVVLPYLPPPIASFDSPTQIRVGTPAQFVDTSANGTTFLWNFGDGGTASTASAIHTFSASGPYNVSFTVTNRNGSDNHTEMVDVLPALPVAGFVPSPAAARVDETVSFTSTSTGASTYLWNFGDGTTSTLASPTHSYATQADYLVTLTVTNSIGETDSTSQTITVDPAPPLVGALTATPSPGTTLSIVTFTVAAAAGSGEIVSYDWDFGDGSQQTTTTNTTTHTYGSSGTYAVWVTATGLLPEDQVTTSVPLTVNDPAPPIVSISASNLAPQLNQVITLTAVTEPGSGPISSYAWAFGDGTTGTGAVVTKAWGTLGAKTVTLTATGPVGATNVPPATTTVTVVAPPPPVILTASGSPSPGTTGQVVNFSATLGPASGPVNSWLWNFGDGTSSTLQNPSKTYPLAATYTVTVTATGPVPADADVFTFSFTVVDPPPVLTAPTYTPVVALVNEAVTFSVGPAQGSGPITSYSWTFSDGGVASGQNPMHTFTTTGAHSATVTATGPGGTSAPVNVVVQVYNPILAQFGFIQTAVPLQAQFTDESTGAPPVSWAWDFNNDTIIDSTVQNPLWTFATAGSKTVTLTVTDGASRSNTRVRVINIV